MSEGQKWQRLTQECDGEYYFNGKIYATSGVKENLADEEILQIIESVHKAVEEQLGVDYLQVFKNAEGRKIYFIDELNKQEVESGAHEEEDHFATIMFAEEY